MSERMSDEMVLWHIRQDTPLNQLRTLFSSWCARIEQEMAQRKPLTPIELRRLEFEAVSMIVEAAEKDTPHAD